MLGRLRRTTRLDVGLALTFAGVAYLVWVLVAGAARGIVGNLIGFSGIHDVSYPVATRAARIVFVDAGVVVDLVGLLWLLTSLLVLLYSSRQRCSISWVWLSAVLQTIVAALGGIGVAWAAQLPYNVVPEEATTWETVSGISLPVLAAVAILAWVLFLVILLVERARLNRHGPTLRDGLRSNVSR